ncbi:hypothetical protein C8F01DRAFT_1086555 [Mycena amicta]|nr:hypothetical protein C8F01DRAFT_1086555 [Mycena amicta]
MVGDMYSLSDSLLQSAPLNALPTALAQLRTPLLLTSACVRPCQQLHFNNNNATNTGPLATLPCADIVPNSLSISHPPTRPLRAIKLHKRDELLALDLGRMREGAFVPKITSPRIPIRTTPTPRTGQLASSQFCHSIDRRPELSPVRVADPHGMAARAASQLMHEGSIEPDRVNANSAMNIRGYLWRFLASYLGVPRRQERVVEALRAGLFRRQRRCQMAVDASAIVFCAIQ